MCTTGYWDDEKCLVLIETYRLNPALWDQTDPNYYKKDHKEHAWDAVGAAVKETPAACKQKMVNILASFRRENSKIRKSMTIGKDLYTSKWYAFEALKFLRDRNSSQSKLDVQNSLSEESDEAGDSTVQSTVQPTVQSAVEPAVQSAIQLVDVPSKKSKAELNVLTEALDILKSVANKPNRQEDELRSFFDFVQSKMKNYNRSTKNSVQHEIFQVIMRADRGVYNYPENFSFQSKSSVTNNSRSTKVRSKLDPLEIDSDEND